MCAGIEAIDIEGWRGEECGWYFDEEEEEEPNLNRWVEAYGYGERGAMEKN